MVKRRPVIVISPRLRHRGKLCAIVPLSTTPPAPIAPYNYKLHIDPVLPSPYDAKFHWVKADMLATVSFERLYLPHSGKDKAGKRQYVIRVIDEIDLRNIRACMLHAVGLSHLTGHL